MHHPAADVSLVTALATFRDWLDRSRGPAVAAALAATTLTLLAVAALLPIPAVPAILGALAGLTLFLTGYTTCRVFLSRDQQARFDPKAHYPLPARRGFTGIAAAAWLILLLLVGRHLPEVLGGALNVAVLLTLFTVWSPTPVEAEAQAAAQAEAEAAAAQADETGEWE